MRARAAGILLHDSKVLLQRKLDESIWALPGGRLKDGESPEQALAREFAEELGCRAAIGRRTRVLLNAFSYNGISITQIEYYFLVSTSLPPHELTAIDDTLEFRWVSLPELGVIDFRPAEVKEDLATLLGAPLK